MLTLLTGGGRSGKSRYALELSANYTSKVFLATAQACDDEMTARIAKHQQERDDSYETIEEPYDLADALKKASHAEVVVIDCLTVWLGNLAYRHGDEVCWYKEIDVLLDALQTATNDVIIVSNEIGLGVIPENALAREFRDLAGSLNQRVAKLADKFYFMASGYPLSMKPEN